MSEPDNEPDETDNAAPASGHAKRSPYRLPALLFVATVASVFWTALSQDHDAAEQAVAATGTLAKLGTLLGSASGVAHALTFTATLLGILTAHELGHYIASRIHGVDASLPHFLPMPVFSPFGTMGAIIRMRGTIKTRRALLDIGAAGPLAGLVFALPLYAWGAAHSTVVAVGSSDGVELGESLIVKLLDHVSHPNVPAGHELLLSPMAYGAWAGMFVTMVNLLPIGQLDGGHVAYALFGRRQDQFARSLHRALLVVFGLRLLGLCAVDLAHGLGLSRLGANLGASLFWFVWFQMLSILGSLARVAPERTAEPTRESAPDAESARPRLSVRVRAFCTIGLVVGAAALRDPADLPAALLRFGSGPLFALWFVLAGAFVATDVFIGVFRDRNLHRHPPTTDTALNGPRKVIAIVTLLFFVGLFMPTPMAM